MRVHPKARERLFEELNRGLDALQVKHGLFVDSFIAFLCFHEAEEVLPKTGKLRDLWEEWIDDSPITTFVGDRVREKLRSRSKYDSNDQLTPLKELEGFDDVGGLANCLLDEFESLPWEYTLTMRFPEALPPFPPDTTTVQLDQKSRLSVCDLFFREAYSLEHEDEELKRRVLRGPGAISLLLMDEFKWEDNAPYFQVEAAGYIGPYGSGSQFDTANRALRRFVGLGLGLKLFDHQRKYTPNPTRRHWVIHNRVGEAWSLHDRLEIDLDDSTVLDSVKLWNSFQKEYPENQRTPWLQSTLSKVGVALNASASSSLGLAAEWFFDSFKGRDETLTYVRRMTCLEILLGEHGDTSKISLGELLGNRLAYLIGRSHTDRERVLKDFKEIYGLRSRILHHGKHRFTREERSKLWSLRSLCERALQEEAKMLTADVA